MSWKIPTYRYRYYIILSKFFLRMPGIQNKIEPPTKGFETYTEALNWIDETYGKSALFCRGNRESCYITQKIVN